MTTSLTNNGAQNENVHRLIYIYSYQLLSGTSFYGTGEASGPLERTGKRVSVLYVFMYSFIANFLLLKYMATLTWYLPLVSVRFSLGIQMHGDTGQELLHYINRTHGCCLSSLMERLSVSQLIPHNVARYVVIPFNFMFLKHIPRTYGI